MQINQNIFRAYDIRGIASKDLSEEFVTSLGSALSHKIKKLGLKQVVVARDGRLSGARICSTLIESFLDNGINVKNVGMVPSPLLYFAVEKFNTKNGVMITGSHNPKEYNGFKIILGGKTIFGQEIQDIKNDILQGIPSKEIKKGNLEEIDILDDYINELRNNISLKRPMKICLDSGNGVGGVIAPQAFKAIGCEVIELFSEVDGNFPNHHPDPSIESNLSSLKDLVLEKKLDIGIAFDGDGDRLGVIDNEGCFISPDIILLILAKSILASNPEAKIIGEVKCTKVLFDEVLKSGGIPIMWKTGHSKIKEKIKEENALLAGELSGHIFFKDKHYGYDDALYAALRLIEIISNSDKKLSDFLSEIPNVITTPEFRIEFSEEEKFSAVDKIIKEFQSDLRDYKISEIDGMRLENESGWALIRASNTQPALTMRFESDSIENLNILQKYVKDKIEKAIGMKCKF